MYHFLVKVFFMFSYSCTTCISDLTKVFYCDIPSVRIALTSWCMTGSNCFTQLCFTTHYFSVDQVLQKDNATESETITGHKNLLFKLLEEVESCTMNLCE